MEELRSIGYIGQDTAAKAMCLMAYRHIKRLRYIYLDQVPPADLPSKENYLLVGPTGCGKTFLIDSIFNRILHLPATIIDITTYSETGYVGQDVVSILTRLVHASGGDYALASIGIICIDEFDKISSGKNTAVFAGAGTTKDVTGMGVQRELLKMLEGSEVDVPIELTHSSYAPRATMLTHNIAFVASGAFSGFSRIINANKHKIGFNGQQQQQERGQKIAYEINQSDLNKAMHFEQYGIMPELIGRFSRIIPFHPLSKQNLKKILLENTLKKYQKEFELAGSQLQIEDQVTEQIIQEAYDRETGARGVKNALLGHIEAACFELYSGDPSGKTIRVFLKDGEVKWEIG